MKREHQLLTFLAARPAATDPIRIVKGLFIFTQRVRERNVPPQQTLYTFAPMQFGPCAMEIYDDLKQFVASGHIQCVPVAGETWTRYRASETGSRLADSIAAGPDNEAARFLTVLRDWCDSLNFTTLIRAVYHAYPSYAANSVLPHLRPNG